MRIDKSGRNPALFRIERLDGVVAWEVGITPDPGDASVAHAERRVLERTVAAANHRREARVTNQQVESHRITRGPR